MSILFNIGDHKAVLRATRRLDASSLSTLVVLRAGSLRMTGDLDTAADTAAQALERARTENHNIRAANAAFQEAFALTWSGRLDDAEVVIDDRLRPIASVAASRWVAWADFLEASVRIHSGHTSAALDLLDQAAARFASEGLVDGRLSVELVRLTALRQARSADGFRTCLTEVQQLMRADRGTYYSKAHRFTQDALALEKAQFARCTDRDDATAERHLAFVLESQYPLHVALAHLGLAALDPARAEAGEHARQAADFSYRIKARRLKALADGLVEQADRADPTPPDEIFFP